MKTHFKQDSSPKIGLCVMYPSPGTIERIGADWDWLWIDGQHGDLDYRDIQALVRAGDLVGCPSFVRVPGQDPAWVGRVLDIAAAGVIVPMIESPEEAQAMVRAAKFPPLGNRSYGGRRPIDRFGRGYYETSNTGTTLLLQIESPGAAEQADAIAAVPGVDGLFLGMDDYALRSGLGVDEPKTRERVGRAYDLAAAACRKHGKMLCAVGVGEIAMKLCLESRCDLIVAGGDVGFLASGSKAASAAAREAIRCAGESQGVRGTLY